MIRSIAALFAAALAMASAAVAEPYSVGPIVLGMSRSEARALKPPAIAGQTPILQCGDDKVQRGLPNPGALTLPAESAAAGMVRCVWLINLDKNWQYFGMAVGGVDVELWLMFLNDRKAKTDRLMQVTLWFRADGLEKVRKSFVQSFGLPVEQMVEATAWRNKESEAVIAPDGTGEGHYVFMNHLALRKELLARLPDDAARNKPAAPITGKR